MGRGRADRVDPGPYRRRPRAGRRDEPCRAGQDPASTERRERPQRRDRHPVRHLIPHPADRGGGSRIRALGSRSGEGDRPRARGRGCGSASSEASPRGRASAGLDILELGAARGAGLLRSSRTWAPSRWVAMVSWPRSWAVSCSAPPRRHGCRSRSSSPRRWGCSPPSSSGPCSEPIFVGPVVTGDIEPVAIFYAVISLTVVRMLPVAAALAGVGLRRDTVAFMGWFGPRGLASVVFTLIAFEDLHGAGPIADAIVEIATWTILLSVVAHGLSAGPSHRHTATACTRRATSQSSPRLRAADPEEECRRLKLACSMNHPHRMMPGRRRDPNMTGIG